MIMFIFPGGVWSPETIFFCSGRNYYACMFNTWTCIQGTLIIIITWFRTGIEGYTVVCRNHQLLLEAWTAVTSLERDTLMRVTNIPNALQNHIIVILEQELWRGDFNLPISSSISVYLEWMVKIPPKSWKWQCGHWTRSSIIWNITKFLRRFLVSSRASVMRTSPSWLFFTRNRLVSQIIYHVL